MLIWQLILNDPRNDHLVHGKIILVMNMVSVQWKDSGVTSHIQRNVPETRLINLIWL
jgi:hypothetical protein